MNNKEKEMLNAPFRNYKRVLNIALQYVVVTIVALGLLLICGLINSL